MIIGHARSVGTIVNKNLYYKGQKIETVKEYNYLGVEKDDNLTMEMCTTGKPEDVYDQ